MSSTGAAIGARRPPGTAEGAAIGACCSLRKRRKSHALHAKSRFLSWNRGVIFAIEVEAQGGHGFFTIYVQNVLIIGSGNVLNDR